MVRKRNPYVSDIIRTIRRSKRRFLSIMVISMLGVMMFSGLKAACEDLRVSADDFFDAQNFHDLSVVSTLGFDDDDLRALQEMDEVADVQGIYTEDAQAVCNDTDLSVTLTTLGNGRINIPYIREGTMPSSDTECAVTERFVKDAGAAIGDVIRVSVKETGDEDQESRILVHEYEISAIVTDVRNVNNPFGSVAYRDAAISSDTIFIRDTAAKSGLYTQIEMRIEGSDELFCFSEEYTDSVENLRKKIESSIRDDREKARTEKIKEEAREKVREEEEKILAELRDAKKKLDEGEQEIKDGQKELDEGMDLYQESRRTAEKALADAQRLIDENRALLDRESENFKKTKADLEKQIEELEENRKQLLEAKDGLAQIDDGLRQLDEGIAMLEDEKVALFMSLLKELPADTPLSEINDGIAQLGDFMDQLEEYGIEIPQTTVKEASETVLSYLEDAQKDRDILFSEQTLALIETLRQQEAETPVSETGTDYEALLEVITKYDPLSAKETCAEFVASYENACERSDAIAEMLADEQAQQMIAILKMADSDEDLMESLSGMKDQFEQMPSQLAEIAGCEEPKTVSELIETYEKALAALRAQRDELIELRRSITDGLSENGIDEDGIDDAVAAIDNGIRQIREGIASGERQIADGYRQLEEGQAQLNASRIDTYSQLSAALAEILDGYEKLREARDELEEGKQEYNEGKEEAEEEFEKAYKTIDEIDKASWYIRDRMALAGYANIDSDAGSIEAIGTVFPAVFLVVAILISLTTITRMVEEERGLIGTYKSLGYTDGEIMAKYLVYAALACVLGSVLGTILAFVALPMFIFVIFGIMYLLPHYRLSFVPLYGICGPLLFMIAILGAVLFAAGNELSQAPASLMRPKAPKAGSRVFLEKITPLWQRMNFLDKVTARNLFRYKKRMLMTLSGIAGCMALLLFGFAIGDSVRDLVPRQYEQTFLYDVMAVAQDADHEELDRVVREHADTQSYLDLMITSARISFEQGRQETLQLFVFDHVDELESYVLLHNRKNPDIRLDENSVLVTLNASNVLGFEKGDTVHLELADLSTADLTVSDLCDNYLGNYVYMTRKGYEKYFRDYTENGMLINLKEGADYEVYEAMIRSVPHVVSALSSQKVGDQFETAFILINAVVYIVIIMSAALAFVVLFTLSSINISERTREIATIKVLGFFDGEVHTYIDRETLILSAIGIVLGIPLGWAFAQTLTSILNLPSIYLAVSLHLKSYFIAAALCAAFAFAVNIFSDRYLDVIDPVEALKSVE